ncbi:MAG: hypothetical protein QM661_09750 [Solimonas sp.]
MDRDIVMSDTLGNADARDPAVPRHGAVDAAASNHRAAGLVGVMTGKGKAGKRLEIAKPMKTRPAVANPQAMLMDALMDLERQYPKRLGFRVIEIANEAGMNRYAAFRTIRNLTGAGLLEKTDRRYMGSFRPAALYRMARTKRQAA